MLKDESIDTASNLLIDQDVLNDEPLASGVDSAPVATGPDLAALANTRLAALKARGLDLARETESRVRQNPFLAIAAAGVASLALGLLVGRLFPASARTAYPSEEYPSGYDE